MLFVIQNVKGVTLRLSRARLLMAEVDLHADKGCHCGSEEC